MLWHGIKIPDKDCFKKGKKCTPDCSSYDLGWLTLEDELKSKDIFMKEICALCHEEFEVSGEFEDDAEYVCGACNINPKRWKDKPWNKKS